MQSMVLSTLVVVANLLGGAMIIPQVHRLHRHRRADGLSATWVGIGVAMNLWWLAYAMVEHRWAMIPVSAIGAVLYSVIGAQLLRFEGRANLGPLALGIALSAVVPVPALVLSGWKAAGLSIGLAYAIQFSPAAWEALSASTSAGLSPATWWMAWAEALIWFVYGLSQGDAALTVGGAGGAIMASLVLLRIHGLVAQNQTVIRLATSNPLARIAKVTQ